MFIGFQIERLRKDIKRPIGETCKAKYQSHFKFSTLNYSPVLGHRGEPLWKGRIRVIETGSGVPSKASIRLEDCNTGNREYSPLPSRVSPLAKFSGV